MEILRIYAEEYISAALHLRTTIDMLKNPNIWSDNVSLHFINAELEEVRDNCIKGELPVTVVLVNSILISFNMAQTHPELRVALESADGLIYKIMELNSRLIDEMKTKLYFQLPISKKPYFDSPRGGWEEILQHFPDCVTDIEEMNRCFALSRYTASMFHALQVGEWGAIALGDYIGVTDPQKGWGSTGKKLKELVSNGHQALPPHLSGQFPFVEQIHQEVDTMTKAWRHKIDHAANRLSILPNQDFGPDLAEHIIQSVKMFMMRLSDGIPKSL